MCVNGISAIQKGKGDREFPWNIPLRILVVSVIVIVIVIVVPSLFIFVDVGTVSFRIFLILSHEERVYFCVRFSLYF